MIIHANLQSNLYISLGGEDFLKFLFLVAMATRVLHGLTSFVPINTSCKFGPV